MHRELVERMLDAGHERANFAIVAAGENAASPHHEPGTRVIADGEVVLCDFGGTMHGYCSDITRMFVVGEPPAEVRDAYAVLVEAQEAGVRAAEVGRAVRGGRRRGARPSSPHAGLGDRFVHRTGHGIGMEAHEDPYIVAGNAAPLAPGHAFSVEPGIYVPGPVRSPAGGHRRRHRRRPAAPQRRGRATSPSSADPSPAVRLELSTVMLQWAAGGLLFGWVTTRRREVGIGYGWLVRGSFGVLAVIGVAAGIANDDTRHRCDGPRRLRHRDDPGDHGRARSCRSSAAGPACGARSPARRPRPAGSRRWSTAPRSRPYERRRRRSRARVPARPRPVRAAVRRSSRSLGAAGADGGNYALAAARLLVGAAFLGVITDAMLLGHWYLVQPGLSREPIRELVRWSAWIFPFEVVLLLVPTGMVSVLNGSIDDGYHGSHRLHVDRLRAHDDRR